MHSHLMLVFTGLSRFASEIAKDLIQKTPKKKTELKTMHSMVHESVRILNRGEKDIADFGKLLHENWKLKRSLTNRVSTPRIDEIYEAALRHGATGGKLLGAGGGGFVLLFVPPERQAAVRQGLDRLLEVPVEFENDGSRIIFYDAEQNEEPVVYPAFETTS